MTSHPFILNIHMARMINAQCGGAVVGPWDVEQLSGDEIDVFVGLAVDLPAMQNAKRRKEEVFEAVRQAHPNYRKYQ